VDFGTRVSDLILHSTIRIPKQGRMDTQSRFLRLRRKDIAYFKFILESYEGMAIVRTKDPYEAIVELMVAPGWEKDADEVLEGLQKEIPFERL
jgi:hypothetical protein